jgi:hypothetical protein
MVVEDEKGCEKVEKQEKEYPSACTGAHTSLKPKTTK